LRRQKKTCGRQIEKKRKRKKKKEEKKVKAPQESLVIFISEGYPIYIYSRNFPTMCNLIARTSFVPSDHPLTLAHIHYSKYVFHPFPLNIIFIP